MFRFATISKKNKTPRKKNDIEYYMQHFNFYLDATHPYTMRFLGFSVYVSNTTKKEDGFLCYHETNHTLSTIPYKMTIRCDVQGRYVIYYNTREGNLKNKYGYTNQAQVYLCEVEVYGKKNYSFLIRY